MAHMAQVLRCMRFGGKGALDKSLGLGRREGGRGGVACTGSGGESRARKKDQGQKDQGSKDQ